MGLPLTDDEILKFWKCEMLKKYQRGYPWKKNFSWKTKMISHGNCLIWREKLKKKGSKNLTAAAGEKKKSNKNKKLDNCTKWRDLKFYGARTNGLEDIQVWNLPARKHDAYIGEWNALPLYMRRVCGQANFQTGNLYISVTVGHRAMIF